MDSIKAQKLVELARRTQAQGDVEGAQLLFRQALGLDPFNAEARQSLQKNTAAGAGAKPAGQPVRPGDASTRPATDLVQILIGSADELLKANDPDGAVDVLQRLNDIAAEDPRVVSLGFRINDRAWPGYMAKLAPLTRRPFLKISQEELVELSSVDHRMGFLLSRIDGQLSVEELFSISALCRPFSALTLIRMIAGGIVTLPPPPPPSR